MDTTTLTASPAKLRDGTWGARVQGTATEGQTVTIRTAAGKVWQARVTRVIWTGEGVTIVATASLDRAPAQSAPAVRASTGGRCRGCRGPIVNARHHRAMGGLCGSCAFDEYDC